MIDAIKTRWRAMREAARQAFCIHQAKRGRSRSKATFIGITGSSGKSTATGVLGHILAGRAAVQTQLLSNTIKALLKLLARRSGKAEYVVAEIGASDTDTVRPMAQLLRPHVAVVTMVALEHYSKFRTLENVAREKRALVDALEPGGVAILNADDPNVIAMAATTRERVVTFGLSETVDYRVADVHAAYPDRLSFSIHWRGGHLALRTQLLGEHFWLPVAAAVATALELGIPPQTIVDRVATFEPLPNRGDMIVVEDGPRFILDTAKAPWHSIGLAFDMMARATAVRRRIVLGQISDYAGAPTKYALAYKAAREITNQVILVGENAHRSKASDDDRASGRFMEFSGPKEVSDHIRQTAVAGELILLKSAQRYHLERIALSWVYDIKCWVPVCGKREGCRTCGLFEVPFEEHPAGRKGRRTRR